MSKLGIIGATALSLALAVATPAFAVGLGVGGGGGMHVGGVGGGGGMHVGGVGGAQASIGDGRVGSVSGGNFTGHGSGQFAQGGHHGDHERHRGYGRGVGFAGGFAAGSALGYGYGGSYDPYYYNDGYAYNDPGYDGYSDSVIPSSADPSYCAQRYRSYDPASGTYLGRDGLRHPCP
jgi:hypothetical protein